MLTLKSLTLKSPIIQSPMVGCTDLAYRMVARKRGMEFCFVEMVSANGLMHASKKTHALMQTAEGDRPLGAQLMGCDPQIMATAAQKMEELGFDSIDLNLGCPVRKVTSQGAGAALLKDPKKAAEVFTAVVNAVKKVPVTVKMRKGFEDESGAEAVQMAKVAEDCGLSAVTVHGRTRAQGYTGKADWEAIGKVKRAVKIPVIGNGDVISAERAKQMREVSGCDGVMIGRGALGNPWLFKQIHATLFEGRELEPPTLEERIEAVMEHMDLEVKYVGAEKAVYHMRRIGTWYIAGITNAAFYRGQLVQCRSIEGMRGILMEALTQSKEFKVLESTMTEGQ